MTTAKPMRLLFVGAGAVGGFLAARTLEAGHDATVLVHPARARALREHGLVLATQSASTTTRPAVVTADELTDGLATQLCWLPLYSRCQNKMKREW